VVAVAASDHAVLMAGHGAHAAVANQSDWFAADADLWGACVDDLPSMRSGIPYPDHVWHI
jgi:hypothetical protein